MEEKITERMNTLKGQMLFQIDGTMRNAVRDRDDIVQQITAREKDIQARREAISECTRVLEEVRACIDEETGAQGNAERESELLAGIKEDEQAVADLESTMVELQGRKETADAKVQGLALSRLYLLQDDLKNSLDGRFKEFRADIEASLEAFRRACEAVGQELAVDLADISWITLDASNFAEFVRPE